jgi:hypothetical protein
MSCASHTYSEATVATMNTIAHTAMRAFLMLLGYRLSRSHGNNAQDGCARDGTSSPDRHPRPIGLAPLSGHVAPLRFLARVRRASHA